MVTWFHSWKKDKAVSKIWEAISFCDIEKETSLQVAPKVLKIFLDVIKIIIFGKISSDRKRHSCLQKPLRPTVVEDGI